VGLPISESVSQERKRACVTGVALTRMGISVRFALR